MILRRITEPCSNTVLFTETNFWNQAGILLRSERFPYQNRETDVPHTKFGRQWNPMFLSYLRRKDVTAASLLAQVAESRCPGPSGRKRLWGSASLSQRANTSTEYSTPICSV